MSLSPEDIEGQQFREVLRGYDKGQVTAFLSEVANLFRTSIQPGGEADDESESTVTVDDIADAPFDDALRGYDKEDVRSFLKEVEVDLRTLTQPTGYSSGGESSARGLVGADVGGDLDVLMRTAQDIRAAASSAAAYQPSASRSATPELVDPAQSDEEPATAARAAVADDPAAARSLRSDAELEVSRLQEEVTRAEGDLAVARSLRSDAEREMSRLQEEAVRVAELTALELQTARTFRAHAEADAAQAAAELAAAIELREEFEAATMLRAQAEAEAARATEELAAAEELRSQAERDSAAAAEELTDARELRREVKSELEKVRAVAVAEGDTIAVARADREEAAKLLGAAQHHQDPEWKEFSHAQSLLKEAEQLAEFLTDLGRQLGELHGTGSQELAEAIRRLEDQILAALGEVQDELQQSRAQDLVLVQVAEERIRKLVQGLQALEPKSLGTHGDA